MDAELALMPGGMRWLVGEIGERWWNPGEEEYPPAIRGDSVYE